MIRRILLASASALALAGTAFAADLPSRAPPPVYLPPPPTWTGFYIGINAGYEWGASNSVNTATANLDPGNGLVGETEYNTDSAALATRSVPVSSSGFIGGGQIGYNYQFAPSWVAGLEADIDGVAASHSKTAVFSQAITSFAASPIDQTMTSTKNINYLGTVRGRLGWLITPTLLVYGTGGLAYGGANASTSITQFVENNPIFLPNPYGSFGRVSNTRVGWTAGGGGEWMFLPNWSVKVEYLYYDLGSVTYGLSPLANVSTFGGGTLFTLGAPVSRTRFNGNVVRAGLNYHFNWGGAPVVARY